uniref:Uncharacterized protein n=1 Tax=Ditylenchus dipsaci TaxID=166011 RepID=A0A915D550_9BILA
MQFVELQFVKMQFCENVNDDGGGADFTDFATDNPASFQTSEPEDIFAEKVADLPKELQEFVDLNGETITVKLPKSHGERIVLPLLAAKNNLSFTVFQEETCLEKEQQWQFNYPAEDCDSTMGIKWEKEPRSGMKSFVLELLGNSFQILGTNFMGVGVNGEDVRLCEVLKDGIGERLIRKFDINWDLPACALNASKYDADPYGSYFDMDFWIENVPSKNADKSGKCDITLKFKAADYKFPTTTTTEKPITESTAENTEYPDDAIHSTPSARDEHADKSLGSFLIWIIVGPIIGLCSILILVGVLLCTSSSVWLRR